MRWWRARSVAPFPDLVAEAVDLGRRGALAWPKVITVRKEGRWWRILSADLDEKPSEWLDSVEEYAFEEVPF